MLVSEIINQSLIDIAKEHEDSVFFAQGINDPNGVFGTLFGLGDFIDPKRLIEMPVAENGGIGSAVGLAIYGKRPVLSFHRVEFVLVALEQILNNAAKANFISGGGYTAPLLIRLVVGRGWGQGPSHSQSFESLFAGVPGLKVVCPSLPASTYDLLRNSFDDDAPTICIEHRWCHYAESEAANLTTRRDQKLGPKLVSEGRELTLISFGFSLIECKLVVEKFACYGVSVELIDLQMLRPLKMELVFASVKKTGRMLFVDQGFKTLGVGSEVVSRVVEHCWSALSAPPRRLGLPDSPSPSSVALADGYYTSVIDIASAIAEMLGLDKPAAGEIIARVQESVTGKSDVPNDLFKGPF